MNQKFFEALSLLDHTKSPGNNRVNPLILKRCALSLTCPITHIINLSFTTSTFPTVWKKHKIIPIPKKGDLHSVTNYRPISLLPIISKVIEAIVHAKLIKFVRPLLNKSQYGFLSNRSCLTQLLAFTAKITNHFESKSSTDVVYLNFQ